MELFDVRNRIRGLLEQGQFKSHGGGMSFVEPEADLEMTYLGRRYIITIRDTDAPQKLESPAFNPDDLPTKIPV